MSSRCVPWVVAALLAFGLAFAVPPSVLAQGELSAPDEAEQSIANPDGQAPPPAGRFSAVAAGNAHTCGIRDNNAIACWGNNAFGQSSAPTGRFSAVAAGNAHTCGIRDNNAIACWGNNAFGRADAPTGRFSAISAGYAHSCGIRSSGAVVCWGNNDDNRVSGAPDGRFSAVSAGYAHSCAIRSSDTVVCWGNNAYNQVSGVPAGQFSAVSAGTWHSCAIRSSGGVVCWGNDGDNRMSGAPAGRFSAVAAGYAHSCAIRSSGGVVCWGNDGDNRVSGAPDGWFSAVSAGYAHSCAIEGSSAVVCWGDNSSGQADAPDGRFSAVAAGYAHSCAIEGSSAVVCWGNNDYSQATAPAGRFSAVSAGNWHSCAIRADGAVVCWGNSSSGQASAPSGRFSAVSAGNWHSCAIRTDSKVVCWGNNSDNQVSDAPAGRFSAVAAGFGHSCAIRTGGAVECWGNNVDGQADPPDGRFSAVSAGNWHSCAVRADGGVVCWGNNDYGQVNAPSGRFSEVSAGFGHSCAVRADGGVVCWGNNDHGQSDALSVGTTDLGAGDWHSCAIRADGGVVCWGNNDYGQSEVPGEQSPTNPVSTFAHSFKTAWSVRIDGWNRSSSPVIADVDGDGQNEIVFGHQDGYLRAYEGNGSLKWKAAAIPGVNRSEGCNPQSTPTAIDSSPAVADIDGDGFAEVVVGVGSTFVPYQNGSVIAFDGRTGAIEWAFNQNRDTASLWDGDLPIPDSWCEGIYATPAIGDVNGDGSLDVVFAGWDFSIWAIDGNGIPLTGFPINNDDTVWSSPALYDADGDGDMEIFIGGDSTPGGYVDHLGGIFRAIDYRNNAPKALWNRFANEVFHSSPAIADINDDGRVEVVVGMGNNWHIECSERANPYCSPGDGSDHVNVWAFHLDDGTNVPGWPVSATDTVWSSPAIGDVDADGKLEIVVGSFDRKVYVWNSDGTKLWSVSPKFPHPHLSSGRVTGHPIIADIDGNGEQDIAVGTEIGLAILDGRSGLPLQKGLDWTTLISFAESYETAAAVGKINGSRHIVMTAFDTPGHFTRVSAVELPSVSSQDAWPMFRHGVLRRGTEGQEHASQLPSDISRSEILQEIMTRDELIVAQESLLNAYRCRFNTDTHVVPGGCVDGKPGQAPVASKFSGIPTRKEVLLRDKLIGEQETLLNTYRCHYGIDTHIVPGKCSDR